MVHSSGVRARAWETSVVDPALGEELAELFLRPLARDGRRFEGMFVLAEGLKAEDFDGCYEAHARITAPVRLIWGAGLFLHMAQRRPGAPDDPAEHRFAVDVLGRDIRTFAAGLLAPGLDAGQTALVGSLIIEADLATDLGQALHGAAQQVAGIAFSADGQAVADHLLERMALALETLDPAPEQSAAVAMPNLLAEVGHLRTDVLELAPRLGAAERGALLGLVASADRTLRLVERIDAERQFTPRTAAQAGPVGTAGAAGV